MKKQTLVERAKTLRSNGKPSIKVTQDHIDLALAWANGEISLKQAGYALGGSNKAPYHLIAIYLREYIRSLGK